MAKMLNALAKVTVVGKYTVNKTQIDVDFYIFCFVFKKVNFCWVASLKDSVNLTVRTLSDLSSTN